MTMNNKPTEIKDGDIYFSPDEILDIFGEAGLMPEEDVAKEKSMLKHQGPGAHESGSPQSAHGKRGSSSVEQGKEKPATDRFREMVMEADGGFTYHPLKNAPQSGFVVSVKPENNVRVHKDEITVADIARYIKKHRQATIDEDTLYIGGWHDPEDGMVHLDTPNVIDDEQEAIALARKHNERAIFNLSTFQVHEVVGIDERDEREKEKARAYDSVSRGRRGLERHSDKHVYGSDGSGADRIGVATARIRAIRKRLEQQRGDV